KRTDRRVISSFVHEMFWRRGLTTSMRQVQHEDQNTSSPRFPSDSLPNCTCENCLVPMQQTDEHDIRANDLAVTSLAARAEQAPQNCIDLTFPTPSARHPGLLV